MSEPKLNGSVNLLGEAMKRVIMESLEAVVPPMEERLNERIDAVKDDIKAVKDDIKKDIAEVRGEVAYARRQGGELGS